MQRSLILAALAALAVQTNCHHEASGNTTNSTHNQPRSHHHGHNKRNHASNNTLFNLTVSEIEQLAWSLNATQSLQLVVDTNATLDTNTDASNDNTTGQNNSTYE
jgi:hypothetical protein